MFKKLRESLEKSAPKKDWKGTSNYPFNTDIVPPRASLSKHWGTSRGVHQWHCDDGEFILRARHELDDLFKCLDIAIESLNKITFGPMHVDDVQSEANSALIKMKKIGDKL